MRILIPFIGVLFLTVTSAQKIITVEETPVVEDGDDEKTRVIDWMLSNSKTRVDTLEEIYEEAHKHGFPDLLLAIAKVESGFDPDAVSHAGAAGLTQVMAHVWEDELKREGIIASGDDLFDISRCIAASAYILGKYLSLEKGNLRNALKRYVGVRSETTYDEKIFKTLGEIHAMKYEDKAF